MTTPKTVPLSANLQPPHLNGTPRPFPKPGTLEWGKMNQRRAELIRKDVSGTLSDDERTEYEYLQSQSLAALDEAFPYPKEDEDRVRALEERLSKQEASGG